MAHGTKKVRRATEEAAKAVLEQVGGEYLGIDAAGRGGHLAILFSLDGREHRHVTGGNDRYAEQSIKRMVTSSLKAHVARLRSPPA